ncbi:nucleotidyltransferase [Candidatus Desulfofervidus auxilii]|uniref:Nucleotidyltransferase n=1 Tax=Desulfofervidus auxilii TaxID=1621989 RepID=A0A7U4QIJ1_DESA2|nr:nucleotidyltransferase domain-containing protein [Candidatus Desulfofervidus auxilii]AMM40013.1 nucleotidyltransferase [Candidatus Desulfofervidus auxilii]CAD7769839.1 Nucleotidyltransferase domain protein [Candidatus Methanoperedenaceae archaeon GB50]CAD7770859.1 Nucleotidyltransferase domain protein [Candidatus Methanoperedenaceae archaeon GB37]CAD7783048.1 MAG: Nucleotidyltransferase domain protein [Candidatus Methanoperedenaceae archaeon GB50]
MNREEAKRILEIMATADGECVYCARELFIQFIKKFPMFSDLARDVFKRKFNEELEHGNEKEILKHTINKVMKQNKIDVTHTILFGSRARGDFKSESDWDVLVIVRNNLSIKEKMLYSKKVRENLAKLGIDCDLIIKSEKEVESSKEMFGSVIREALKEGMSL